MADFTVGKITQLTHTPLEAYGNPIKQRKTRYRKNIVKKGNRYSPATTAKGEFIKAFRRAKELKYERD